MITEVVLYMQLNEVDMIGPINETILFFARLYYHAINVFISKLENI